MLILIFIIYCRKDHLFAEHHEFFEELACLLMHMLFMLMLALIRMNIFLTQQLLLLHLYLHFYSVLFKALFNTLFIFKMTSHAHTHACIEINAANNAELCANAQNVHTLTHAE